MYSMALDNSWAIMNEEEMYDVNGGLYLSNSDLQKILIGLGINPLGTALITIGAYKLGLAAAIPSPISWILAAYLAAHAVDLGSAITSAIIWGKGIDIGAGFYWGIPRITFDVR